MAASFHHDLQAQPPWVLLLSCLGLLRLLGALLSLLRWLYVTFLRPGKDLKSYGSWAVVTGATDGIGRAFAFQLAREGLHLVLVGRSPGKLGRVRDAIKAASGSTVHVKCVVVDLAGDSQDGIRRLKGAIRELDVGILVNNAGTTYPQAMYFHEVDEEVWEGIVRVNVEGPTRLSRAVLPAMMKRGRGAVVNVGSAASMVLPSFPLYDVYAATKAYVDQQPHGRVQEPGHRCPVPGPTVRGDEDGGDRAILHVHTESRGLREGCGPLVRARATVQPLLARLRPVVLGFFDPRSPPQLMAPASWRPQTSSSSGVSQCKTHQAKQNHQSISSLCLIIASCKEVNKEPCHLFPPQILIQ